MSTTPTPPVAAERQPGNGVAVAAVVFGIITALLTLTIIGVFFAIPFALAGLICGTAGVIRARRGWGRSTSAWFGLILSAMPIVLAIAMAVGGGH